jgi:hypothetical protein
MEQVLEAALDLLLEKQARARGLVKKPRTRLPVASPTATSTATSAAGAPAHHAAAPGETDAEPQHALPPLAVIPTEPPPPRRTGSREGIPAAVKRAVWVRDQGRCSWPLDSGGVCGSTHRLELDHIDPWARWGDPTEANLRLVCGSHNALAARREFGARCVERYRSRPTA